MQKNHFSVVTVVRNDLAGLKLTRTSLESQKYQNWTHIIIDAASTDGTFKFLQSLPKEKTVYISEPDGGIYDAMNKAWKMAAEESYVYYLNARDIFADTQSLKEANFGLQLAGNPDWGCTTHEEIYPDGSNWVCKLVSQPSIRNQLYAFGYRSHQAVLMKQRLISELGGFNESYNIAADWDLIVRAITHSVPAIWVHSLGRFELGGESSGRLLEAHLELRAIRRKTLWRNPLDRFFDDLWCAIYLRYFGYTNYLTWLLNYLWKQPKPIKSTRQRIRYLNQSRFNFLGLSISISITKKYTPSLRELKNRKLSVNWRWSLMQFLNKKLNLNPYGLPSSQVGN